MVSPSTIMRASRPILRQSAFSAQATQAFRAQRFGQKFRFRESSKRWQSTADGAQQQHQSWFKRMWESEIGIKTVHFWYVFFFFSVQLNHTRISLLTFFN